MYFPRRLTSASALPG